MSSDEAMGEAEEAALDHVVEQQTARRMPANERLQVLQIQALETEQLEEEEVDTDSDSEPRPDPQPQQGLTFDTSLASRHAYLGDVEDVEHGRAFLEEGSVVKLPMLYLEGIVLFPEATLPLRVVHQHQKAAVIHAMHQTQAAFTIGAVYTRTRPFGAFPASVGTTAEIRQLGHCPDGSMSVVAKGRQRFKVLQGWIEPDATLCAEVEIIGDSVAPLVPRDAFTRMAAVPSLESGKVPRMRTEAPDMDDSEADIDAQSTEANFSLRGRIARYLSGRGGMPDELRLSLNSDENSSDDEGQVLPRWLQPHVDDSQQQPTTSEQALDDTETSSEAGSPWKKTRVNGDWGGACEAWARDEAKLVYRPQRAAWPHWVYRMYDASHLARRAADMWRQMVELPSMEGLVQSPDLLSFFIASKMPLPDDIRQELLETKSVVYRLRREIELLQSMDEIRCKACKTTIARRSDMLVMSTDGPVNAFVNEHGYVHETLTLRKARDVFPQGHPETKHSWFPGYAWRIAYCICDAHMGWRFTAVKNDMHPRAFWGIRRSQIL